MYASKASLKSWLLEEKDLAGSGISEVFLGQRVNIVISLTLGAVLAHLVWGH